MKERRSRNLGTIAKRTKGLKVTELMTTQFALEKAMKRIAALEKQCDGLALLDKERNIQANEDRLRIKHLEARHISISSSVKSLETRVNGSEAE